MAPGTTASPATPPWAAPSAAARAPSFPLTARIRQGDETAFAAFYDAWFDRLLAMARAATRRDESFCLDVVHDTMLRVVRKLPPLASEDAVAAWLARALLHGAVDRLRQDARRARREDAVAKDAAAAHHDTDILDREERAWLRARLDELPAADRALLLARFDDGLTLDAVGQAFGVTGDAAHGRIRRLLLRLKHAAKGAFDA